VLWFFLLLAPTSSVVPLADLLAEHRVYLASWGLLVAGTVLVERLLSRLGQRRAAWAGAVLVGAAWLALGAATHRRNAVWETRLAYWTDAAAKSPQKARVHLGLGQALGATGDPDGALREYALALRLSGENRVLQARVHGNVAAVHTRAGRLDAGAAAYATSLELDATDPDTLAGLALVRARRGEAGEAEALAGRALALAPGHGPALDVLGGLRLEQGDPAGAAGLFEQAARADPEEGAHLVGLGFAYRDWGRAAQACATWRAALRLRLDARQRGVVERAAAGAGCP
jgi:tetratricopeptide (TPR) repeat protein